MSARRIDGKAAAAAIREAVAGHVSAFAQRLGRPPGLATVLVGEDPASAVYVRMKNRATAEAGMAGFAHNLPAATSEADLLQLVTDLNADQRVDGILVQLPLPAQIDATRVIETIEPGKDVDGFHPMNAGRLATGLPSLVPCTPFGCLHLLKAELGTLAGLDAVVIGRSNIVGKPMAQLLIAESATVTVAHSKTRDLPAVVRRADIVVAAVGRAEMVRGDWIKPGATVTVAHSKTNDLPAVCRSADLLVAAIGRPEMVRGDWIKPGATVIDVGINRVPGDGGKSRIVGDVAFAEAMQVAGAVTPVPGGVGPMTIACLLLNTLRAACAQKGLPAPKV